MPLKKVVFSFDAPRTPGDYVVRFFPSRCRYTSTAQGNPVRILNRDKLSLEVVKDPSTRTSSLFRLFCLEAYSPFTERPLTVRVHYEMRSVDVTPKDYIALYKTSAPNNAYVTYTYVDPTKNVVEIPAPAEIDQYEARYHSASKSRYADVARSNSFTVPSTIPLFLSMWYVSS